MTPLHRKISIGGILIFVGASILPLATNMMRTGIRDVHEYSFCVAGYLSVAGAAGFGITGLGAFVTGLAIMRLARR